VGSAGDHDDDDDDDNGVFGGGGSGSGSALVCALQDSGGIEVLVNACGEYVALGQCWTSWGTIWVSLFSSNSGC
jgi:hypothetical protein